MDNLTIPGEVGELRKKLSTFRQPATVKQMFKDRCELTERVLKAAMERMLEDVGVQTANKRRREFNGFENLPERIPVPVMPPASKRGRGRPQRGRPMIGHAVQEKTFNELVEEEVQKEVEMQKEIQEAMEPPLAQE